MIVAALVAFALVVGCMSVLVWFVWQLAALLRRLNGPDDWPPPPPPDDDEPPDDPSPLSDDDLPEIDWSEFTMELDLWFYAHCHLVAP